MSMIPGSLLTDLHESMKLLREIRKELALIRGLLERPPMPVTHVGRRAGDIESW